MKEHFKQARDSLKTWAKWKLKYANIKLTNLHTRESLLEDKTMDYLIMPVKNKNDEKKIIDDYYGDSFIYEKIDNLIITHIYDGDNPIIIELMGQKAS